MLSSPSTSSAFACSINLLILPGFPLAPFHVVEASLSAFSWLYTFVCAVVQNFCDISFIYNYSHFQYSFCKEQISFAQNVKKLWSNRRTVHVNERNQNKSKATSRHVSLIARSIARISPQILLWYHERHRYYNDLSVWRAKKKIYCQ